MHAKLAQKAAEDKKKEEQLKAEEDAKMMAAVEPSAKLPPWSRSKSTARSSSSKDLLGMDQTTAGDAVREDISAAGGDTSHARSDALPIRGSPWRLKASALHEASERQLAIVSDGRKEIRTAWVPCLHCPASLALADVSCWSCGGLNISNLKMSQEEKNKALVDENLAIAKDTDFYFAGFGFKRGVKSVNAGTRAWWTKLFVKRIA